MSNNSQYSKCPKCGLNYITGGQRECSVCVSESRPYKGKYCKDCGCKSGMFERCWNCNKLAKLSANERRVNEGYRTDTGMLGVRAGSVCQICGAAAKLGRLCGKCYNSIVYNRDAENETDT